MYNPGKTGPIAGTGGLAATGASLGWWISLAVVLVVASTLVLLFAARRKRLGRADLS